VVTKLPLTLAGVKTTTNVSESMAGVCAAIPIRNLLNTGLNSWWDTILYGLTMTFWFLGDTCNLPIPFWDWTHSKKEQQLVYVPRRTSTVVRCTYCRHPTVQSTWGHCTKRILHRNQWILLMYSKFTPTRFGKWLPSSGGRRWLRSYSNSVCIMGVYGLRSVQYGQLCALRH
jgi:hypothetical protein